MKAQVVQLADKELAVVIVSFERLQGDSLLSFRIHFEQSWQIGQNEQQSLSYSKKKKALLSSLSIKGFRSRDTSRFPLIPLTLDSQERRGTTLYE